ncbi:MAG: alpha-L-rhamnosidase [Acidobacteriaceae bacterium]
MQRRRFLGLAAAAAAAQSLPYARAFVATNESLAFPGGNARWRPMWDDALATLAANVVTLPHFDRPVLIEGAVYEGVWQECGPQEGLVYASLDWGSAARGAKGLPPTPSQIAIDNHMAFFALQREDGQLPASVKRSEVGFAQIQMVVPIAATAWEVAQISKDDEFLSTAYVACSRWDAWLRRYRNTRGTGLVEGFCTYDTGQDNSPRWAGMPKRCPNGDARVCPPVPSLPRLCPDLSATVYGGRVALAAMARALGKPAEGARWEEDAETIRRLIIEKLYSPEDAAFFDLNAQNRFVKVRGTAITRVLGEHVLKPADAHDRRIFDEVWRRQIHNPDAFWAPYPFPSIALNDPAFVRPIPRNSWGGAAQALTALRAPRWMTFYGKQAELRHLMRQWVEALVASHGFRQQMDPMTGAFTMVDPGGYSPAALVYLDFVRRIAADEQLK